MLLLLEKESDMKNACCVIGPSQRVEKGCNRNRRVITGIESRYKSTFLRQKEFYLHLANKLKVEVEVERIWK